MIRNIKRKCISVVAAFSVLMTAVPGTITVSNAAASTYNYGEALQKAIMFYEFQRSGKLPADKRDNWRGDAGLTDGSDVGVDLSGGLFDAGDHVKFNLPMSYTAAMLSWSVYKDKAAYEKSGQLKYITDTIRYIDDYLMKCHPSGNVYYYQVGDGEADHKWWGPAEVMQMARPTAVIDSSHPGSTVVAESAAALASAALIFKDSDPSYSQKCLTHAKQLFDFADTTKSDKGYTAADGYYKSWSGFYDELSWAAAWIAMASGDQTYVDKAETYVPNWQTEDQSKIIKYRWAQCWDDVHIGAALLLAQLTNKDTYKNVLEMNLDYWTTGYSGNKIKYTPKGLAWMDSWGSLRYATTQAFIASVYSQWKGCTPEKVKTYQDFAKSQVDYALGSSGRSYLIGFGVNPPQHPHHRTAQGSWADDKTVPGYHRHTLIGALVGGPAADDTFSDDVGNFNQNEPACDYNAGFVGALAGLYSQYGGDPISGLNAVEKKTNDELYVEASINSQGPNYIEIKALVNNKTGWPARVTDKMSFKYFMDLSEVAAAGVDPKTLKTSVNYNEGAKVSAVLPWDESKNIYYVTLDFSGTKIYPGGQSAYKKQVQFRIAAPEGTKYWDNSNDYSFTGVGATADSPVVSKYIPLYDDGKLVFGNEPPSSTTVTKKKGDVNCDDKINSTDYSLLKRYILQMIDAFPDPNGNSAGLSNADMNDDGKVNSVDLSALKRLLLTL